MLVPAYFRGLEDFEFFQSIQVWEQCHVADVEEVRHGSYVEACCVVGSE